VNDSFGAEPARLGSARPQLPVPDSIDSLEDEGDSPENEGERPFAPRREGLPPGFRMRHDSHYVEDLMARPTIAPPSALSAYPSVPPSAERDDREPRTPAQAPAPTGSAAAVAVIARRLESIVAHSAIASRQASLIGRTVQAELQRLSRFARAAAILDRQTEPARRPVTTRDIAAAIQGACARSAQIAGGECLVVSEECAAAMAVDRALVVQAIAGTVDALLDLAQASDSENGVDEASRITVSLEAVKVRPAVIVDVACPTLTLRGATADRLFAGEPSDFVEAPCAGILLASAAHVVRLHGGRVEVQNRDGLRLRFVFPADVPRATPMF
jgi:hypothetical protein